MRLKALAEIYTMHSFAQLCNLKFLSKFAKVDSIVLGQAAGVEHVSFYSRTEHPRSPYNKP